MFSSGLYDCCKLCRERRLSLLWPLPNAYPEAVEMTTLALGHIDNTSYSTTVLPLNTEKELWLPLLHLSHLFRSFYLDYWSPSVYQTRNQRREEESPHHHHEQQQKQQRNPHVWLPAPIPAPVLVPGLMIQLAVSPSDQKKQAKAEAEEICYRCRCYVLMPPDECSLFRMIWPPPALMGRCRREREREDGLPSSVSCGGVLRGERRGEARRGWAELFWFNR